MRYSKEKRSKETHQLTLYRQVGKYKVCTLYVHITMLVVRTIDSQAIDCMNWMVSDGLEGLLIKMTGHPCQSPETALGNHL